MKTKTILIAALSLAILSIAGERRVNAQGPSKLVDRIASEAPLNTASWGMKAVDSKGRVLAEYNSAAKMAPASNMKLITSGCALHSLGADFRFPTSIAYSGEIVDGTLKGDIYIVGGGDPTIGSADSIAVKADGLFWKWKSAMKAAGINAIEGRIIGDGRLFEGHLENTSWEYDDVGTDYGAGSSALSFYANAQDYEVSAGAKAGDPVNVRISYPETPWLHFTNLGTTGPAGTGNSLYLYATDLAPYAELRGTFALGRKPKTEHFANKYGAMTCAYYFYKNLVSTGWTVSGGYADIDRLGRIRGVDFVPGDKASNDLKTITTTFSPSLFKISRETLSRSDNFYAEAMMRIMGEKSTDISVYDSCRVAEIEVLEDLCPGISEELSIDDGSGLSRHNFVSASTLVKYLVSMKKSPAFGSFIDALPYPGSEGTLKYLLSGLDPAVRKRIRMKSGSMDGVLCYSGYIIPASGNAKDAIVFSILTNNCDAPVGVVRAKIMSIITELTKTQ